MTDFRIMPTSHTAQAMNEIDAQRRLMDALITAHLTPAIIDAHRKVDEYVRRGLPGVMIISRDGEEMKAEVIEPKLFLRDEDA